MIGVLALIQHRIALIDRTFYSFLLIYWVNINIITDFGTILLPILALFYFRLWLYFSSVLQFNQAVSLPISLTV